MLFKFNTRAEAQTNRFESHGFRTTLSSRSAPVELSLTSHCTEYAFDQLMQLKPQWDELYADSPESNVFGAWDWTVLWWRHFHDYFPEGQGVLTVVAAWQGSLLIGLAPFSYPLKRAYGMNRLRPLGDVDVREGMTDEPPLLLRGGYEDKAIQAIQTYLAKPIAPERWDCSFLRSAEAAIVPECMGCGIAKEPIAVSQIARLASSWELYQVTLSRSMRTNLSYYPRRLEKHGHRWSFRAARTVEEVREALPHLISLHKSRSESTRGIKHVDHIPTARHAEFLTETLVRQSEAGQAWIGIVEIDGKPAAAQAFLETKRTLTFYYSGFDAAYYDFSPLLLLASKAIQESIPRGVEKLNFLPDRLTPDGSILLPWGWKARWGAAPAQVIVETAQYAPHFRAHTIKRLRTLRDRLRRVRTIPTAKQTSAGFATDERL